jgi:TolB-like protein/tetratricopeptide (TPR) repeat protein
MSLSDIPSSGATPGPEGSPLPGKKLDSWGEIASYLGREVRTVQRWERTEGLPVHRHEHKKKSTVYAFTGELDAWIKKRQPKDDPEADDAFAREQELSGTDSPVEIVGPPIAPPAPSPSPDPDKPTSSAGKRVVFSLFALGILCALSLGVYRWLQARQVVHEKVRMVVLPFTNISGDSTKDFLSRGMTDVITTQLGQLDPQHLGVIAPTSAAVMAGHPIVEIGEKLNVQYILEGSVQPIGEQVQINVRLLQVSDETELGSKSLTRPFAHVIELESEVAETVARMMVTTIPVSSPAAPPPGALSPEAARESNEAFFKAESLWTPRSDLKSSVALFAEATQENPYNALAFAGLARATAIFGQVPNDGMSPADSTRRAREAAQRALLLDPKLAEPHAVLGNLAMSYDWDLTEAEKELGTAIRLNPNYLTAHDWYAHLLMVQGRFEEALAESQHVLELEPATPLFHAVRAEILYYARRYDESLAEASDLVKKYPKFVYGYYWLGCAYREKHMYPEAIATFDRARQLTNDLSFMVMAYGHAQAMAGNAPEARQALNTLTQRQRNQVVPDVYLAAIYLGLGEKDQAFRSLNRAYLNRIDRLIYLKVEPMSDPLRSDPRFAELMKKIGFH